MSQERCESGATIEGIAYAHKTSKCEPTWPGGCFQHGSGIYYNTCQGTPRVGHDVVCMKEAECNWQCYLNRYKDLRDAFGPTNTESAKKHYSDQGQAEGRDCTCQADVVAVRDVGDSCPTGFQPMSQERCESGATIEGIAYAHKTSKCEPTWPGGCFQHGSGIYYNTCQGTPRVGHDVVCMKESSSLVLNP